MPDTESISLVLLQNIAIVVAKKLAIGEAL
jgi:hypothetical protein